MKLVIRLICENIFCLYQKKNKCILREISLNDKGECTQCINVSIDDAQLEKNKSEQLLELFAR